MMAESSIGRWTVSALAAAVALLVVLIAPAPARAATDPCALLPGPPPATYQHVVVIMEENLSYKNAIGNAKAPSLNLLAQDCALATNYHAATHPSQPNYMAVTGGAATGVGVHDATPSIFAQAPSWLSLEESMSAPCGGTSALYKRGHDPAFWYTPLAATCKLDDLPMSAADAGASGIPAQLPGFTWITPNLCHDDHWQTGCSGSSATQLATMDTWLAGTLATITATPDYQAGGTLVLVTFDEGQGGTTGEDCTTQLSDPSCKVVTVAVAATVQPHRDATLYTHYSLLRSIEEALGITTFLGNAAGASDMRPGMGF